LRKALEEAISFSRPLKDLEAKKVLHADNKDEVLVLRINAMPLLLNGIKHAVVVMMISPNIESLKRT
jgi:hypothetical protein